MEKTDTVVLHNLPPNVNTAALRLALGEGSIERIAWGTAPGVGSFAVVKLASDSLAWRLLDGSPTNTGVSLGPSNHDTEGPAGPLRVSLSGRPLAVDPCPVSISDVFIPAPKQRLTTTSEDSPRGGQKRTRNRGDGATQGSTPPPTSQASPGKPLRASGRHVTFDDADVEHVPQESSGASPAGAKRTRREDEPSQARGEKTELLVEQPTPVQPAAEKPKFPPGSCKFCGSTEHLSRQCKTKGTSNNTAPTAPTASPVAGGERARSPIKSPKAAARPAATSTEDASPKNNDEGTIQQAPVKVTKVPSVVQRATKDACKHCGQDSHLSRQCPTRKRG